MIPIIPVIDLKNGQAVHAQGGHRSDYRPIQTPLTVGKSPFEIGQAMLSAVNAEALYCADLDALAGREPQWDTLQTFEEIGAELWLDLGPSDPAQAAKYWDRLRRFNIRSRLIVALESLRSAEALQQMAVEQWGPPIFSLDLRQGCPRTQIDTFRTLEPLQIAGQAARAGFNSMIVLDTHEVGTESGCRTRQLCADIRRAHPELSLISGGGVRSPADVQGLAEAGCDAVLVATAIHKGVLSEIRPRP